VDKKRENDKLCKGRYGVLSSIPSGFQIPIDPKVPWRWSKLFQETIKMLEN
jgi:hypothetical protein